MIVRLIPVLALCMAGPAVASGPAEGEAGFKKCKS